MSEILTYAKSSRGFAAKKMRAHASIASLWQLFLIFKIKQV